MNDKLDLRVEEQQTERRGSNGGISMNDKRLVLLLSVDFVLALPLPSVVLVHFRFVTHVLLF